MHRITCGYSLYELLITLTLVSLVTLIAVPGFEKSVANGQIRTEIDALFHAVHLARKESIMRRNVVSICPSENGVQCSASTNWSAGWIMFNNRDRDEPPRADQGEELLLAHRSSTNVRITANRRGFSLRSTDKRATNGTLIVCDRQNRVAARALVVSYTGRPRVALRRPGGEQYFCLD